MRIGIDFDNTLVCYDHLFKQLAQEAGHANGMLYNFYTVAIASGVAPLVIFMGVGAMTDFGPLLANPKTLFLGAAAQFGIFATLLGALGLQTRVVRQSRLGMAR